jgi:hypothetical protein
VNIGDEQIQLINKAKFFLKKLDSSNINSSLSGFCYFTSWAKTPGYAILKRWQEGWFFIIKFWLILLKNVLAIASNTKYVEFSNENLSVSYETIVVSWCFKKNFQKDGSFKDRYFSENSKDLPKSYWILLSMDGYVPTNLNNNIKILKKEKSILKYNFFSFIKILFSTIIESRLSPKKICHYLYFSSYFAKVVTRVVKKEFEKKNFKAILLPYEAQPFQNNIFFEIKKINKKIKTIGYLHSLNPFTGELVYRTGAPDLLLVHGKSQIEILKSNLDWPEDRLILTQSFRYRLNDDDYLSNKIFLPLSIFKSGLLINEFKKFLMNLELGGLPNLTIQNHPVALNSKKHVNFEKKLKELINIYEDRFRSSSKKKISIFFGVTDAFLEALERGIDVIHICSDPIFEAYSEKIWKNLKIKQLSNYIFQYNLILPGKYIMLGETKKILHKTLEKLY